MNRLKSFLASGVFFINITVFFLIMKNLFIFTDSPTLLVQHQVILFITGIYLLVFLDDEVKG